MKKYIKFLEIFNLNYVEYLLLQKIKGITYAKYLNTDS